MYPDDSPSHAGRIKHSCPVIRARQTGYHINVYPDDSPSHAGRIKHSCPVIRARQTGYHINVYPDDSPSHIRKRVRHPALAGKRTSKSSKTKHLLFRHIALHEPLQDRCGFLTGRIGSRIQILLSVDILTGNNAFIVCPCHRIACIRLHTGIIRH